VQLQIIESRLDKLPEYAPAWTEALQARLRSLIDEIEDAEKHRRLIITRLTREVEKAFNTLRAAQSLSKLPRKLGDWGGREFIRFHFEPVTGELLAAHLGGVVDEAARSRTGPGSKIARDGISLLLYGVRAAAPGGFRVDILKPDAVLRNERERVSNVKDVFSGGQQLTAAILLYCTMAALRADRRGRRRAAHAGVLFLDNPIGRANADYLLDLQCSVAAALGVQLVYTQQASSTTACYGAFR
jgi:hypothetical protein